MTMTGEAEHPTPTCPYCGGETTRPLDADIATCFDCDAEWYYDESYSDDWGDI